ncbi:unnamed protein product [Linum trigynum]|uniref:Uncharacterized protein n=1 Tax=Linum trigynum TaxID=586398 RepID=A0AAV2ESN4_9ROSI
MQEVDLRSFVDLEEALHLAIKIEKQQKGVTSRKFAPANKQRVKVVGESNLTQTRPELTKRVTRSSNPAPIERSGGIQCFKCHGKGHKANQYPNVKTLILRDGAYLTDEEQSSSSDKENDKEEIEMEDAPPGKLLGVSRRALTLEQDQDRASGRICFALAVL